MYPSLPFMSRGVRALAARAPVRCSFSRAREQDLAIRLSTSSTPTTTVDETPSSGLQDDLMTYPACSHGRGTFKKTIFATRSLLVGHSSTLESLVMPSTLPYLPIPPTSFHPTRSPPSTPRTSWWPPQHALTGPALSRNHSSPPVACSATPFPWSRWSASLPPPIPPFHPTRSPPSTPRTSWWPPQHALTGPALSRNHSSPPVACSATPFPWSRWSASLPPPH